MSRSLSIVVIVLLLVGAIFLFPRNTDIEITNFEECVEAGNPVMLSYPPQCRAGGETFIEDISNDVKEEPEPAPLLFISSLLLEQGDTLLVKVENVSSGVEISGSFRNEELSFFSLGSNTLATIVGIDTKAISGKYNLSVRIGDENIIKEITVLRKDFPVTELVITSELEAKGYTPSTVASGITKRDGPSINDATQKHTSIAHFDEGFGYPLDTITNVGAFGNIRKQGDSAIQHLGVDLDAHTGTPVYSINSGMVVFTETLVIYGNTLVVDHGLGIYSLYLHLSSFGVAKDEMVARGQIVGYSGNSGYSIEPHLHFSVKVDGARVDLLRFIDTVRDI